jgi:hypothetical protein
MKLYLWDVSLWSFVMLAEQCGSWGKQHGELKRKFISFAVGIFKLEIIRWRCIYLLLKKYNFTTPSWGKWLGVGHGNSHYFSHWNSHFQQTKDFYTSISKLPFPYFRYLLVTILFFWFYERYLWCLKKIYFSPIWVQCLDSHFNGTFLVLNKIRPVERREARFIF